MRRFFWILLLTGLTSPALTNAQTSGANSKNAFLRVPFDVGVTQLPPNFAGYDCASIAGKLKSLRIDKGEFESITAHAERAAILLQAPLSGSITGDDPMVFAAPLKSWEFAYDPDAEKASVTLRFLPRVFTSDRNHGMVPGYTITEGQSTSETYIGSNAYGAKAKVTDFHRKVCGVGFINLDHPEMVLHPYKYQFKATPEAARKMKEGLSIAFVGSLAQPYVGDYFSGTKATISSPQSLSMTGPSVVMRLDEVWLFERASGEILGKQATWRPPSPAIAR